MALYKISVKIQCQMVDLKHIEGMVSFAVIFVQGYRKLYVGVVEVGIVYRE